MEISMHERPQYPILNSGIDWVTTFNSAEFHAVMCGEYMDGLFDELKTRGHHVTRSVRMGYIGRATEGAFHGFMEGKTLAILTSDLAREFGVGLIKVSQKTSRLDLQVTVDASAERPCLSLDAYRAATLRPSRAGRPREYKLTRTHPQGDTFNVCKRTSEGYGRLYDWGAAHKTAERHHFWRYELETKGNYCRRVSNLISNNEHTSALAERLVYEWFRERSDPPSYAPRPISYTYESPEASIRPGILAWFESSVSVSVARAIKEYGLLPVLQSLRLESLVDANNERRESNASAE